MMHDGHKKTSRCKCQFRNQAPDLGISGNGLLLVLLIYGIISVLCLFLVNAAWIESHTSRNSMNLHQAWQMADSGIDLVVQAVLEELEKRSPQEYIPAKPLEEFGFMEIAQDIPTSGFQLEPPGITLVSENPVSCVYRFTITGIYDNAVKSIMVEVKYDFATYYLEQEEQIVFDFRLYTNNGKIVKYQAYN
ncbi:MAG: hypothetical protein ACOXZ5_02350 [Syntrophomonadaceae bacterium]|jgi:hypothetical protein